MIFATMEEVQTGFFYLGIFVVVTAGVVWWLWQREIARSDGLKAMATALGLRFDAKPNDFLAKRFNAVKAIHRGFSHRVWNVFHGNYHGQNVVLCDYEINEIGGAGAPMYKGWSNIFSDDQNSRGMRVMCTELPRPCPVVVIVPHDWYIYTLPAEGYADVDLGDKAFHKDYWVCSTDAAFARHLCTEKIRKFLLMAEPAHGIQIFENTLAILCEGKLESGQVQPELDRLLAVRKLLPTLHHITTPSTSCPPK